MGRERLTIEVSATLSRHNSEEDERDNRLWDELIEAIKKITRDPKFVPIYPSVN